MHLRFPELRGGPQQGLNDAGVENFQGAVDSYLVRECGQNTGDAPREGVATTRLEFDRFQMPAAEIPGFSELRATLVACLEKWGHKDKEREFFETALAAANAGQVTVLKISDYGTTGLTGGDTEERGRWFALVKSQGVSNKGDTAGGSFGIGKSSPFAASRFRTVFYGTRTPSGEVAFQGVSRLVTHKGEAGKLTQGVGFIGTYDADGDGEGEPVFRAIRNANEIPLRFRRDEPGTDIWVLAYRSGDEWEEELTKAILKDFWPAIHLGKIEFRVGGQRIRRDNVGALIQRFAATEDFEVDAFYRAATAQPIRARLREVGDCELYLATAQEELPRRVCMARQSGMRIYDYPPRACRVPFVGLFICTDPDGNALLRQLEPPKHDAWDWKRVEGTRGKRALDQIKAWIRDEVKKLNPYFTGDSFNEADLARYLPDSVPDDLTDVPAQESGSAREEQLEPRNEAPAPPVPAMLARPARDSSGASEDAGEGADGQGGVPPHAAGTEADRRTTPAGGRGGAARPPRVHSRSVREGPGRYRLILRSEEMVEGAILLKAVGEDGATDDLQPVRVSSQEAGSDGLAILGNRVTGVRLAPGQPLSVVVEVSETARRALSVVVAP